MSETNRNEVSAGQAEQVDQRLARAIRALPGVQRMEPTLVQAIARLAQAPDSPDDTTSDAAGVADASGPDSDHKAAEGARRHGADRSRDHAADGVTVTRRPAAVDVTVEISVAGPGSALDTAVAVRELVYHLLRQESLTAGEVRVRVLAIDPEGTGRESEPAKKDAQPGADGPST